MRKERTHTHTHAACSGRVSCVGVCDSLYVCNGVCTFPIYRTSQYSLTLSPVMFNIILWFGRPGRHTNVHFHNFLEQVISSTTVNY